MLLCFKEMQDKDFLGDFGMGERGEWFFLWVQFFLVFYYLILSLKSLLLA